MQLRLITRADDAGSNETANRAILETCRDGIVRNVSLMAPCSAIDHAARVLRDLDGVCFGVHTTMNAEWDRVRWGPVLGPAAAPELTDSNGHFLQTTRELAARGPSLSAVMAEVAAQLALLRDLGFDICYADAHMGWTRSVAGACEAMEAWCAAEGLVFHARRTRSLPPPAPQLPRQDPVAQLLSSLEIAMAQPPPRQYALVGHPAYDTAEMWELGHAGYPPEQVVRGREWERRRFTDPLVREFCLRHNVVLTRYDDAEDLG